MSASHTRSRTALLPRLRRSRWLHPLNDPHAWESILSGLNPMWSRRGIPARIVGIDEETADTKSFRLRVGKRWPGHLAGQHVVVEVEIEGRRLHRSFSLSSAPLQTRELRITVKAQTGSRVSQWMHQKLSVGDVIRLSKAAGDFCAPGGKEPLLLLAAGSGITPIAAILHDLKQRDPNREISLIVCCRDASSQILRDEIDALAADWPALKLHSHFSAERGRLDAQALWQTVPDLARRQALVCGPAALVEMLEDEYAALGMPERVRSESYRGRVFPTAMGSDQSHVIRLDLTEQVFTARGDRGLLGEAELAGLKPAHGCRIGICKSCQCLKRSGSVIDLRTGKISSEPDELIQLCISAPRSALNLVL